jgi:hypothetical protein
MIGYLEILSKMMNFRVFAILPIVMFSSAVFFSVPITADFGFFDAGRHGMDGLFFADVIRDFGIFNPLHYVVHYYQHYPAITPVQYPALFPLCESILFMIIEPHPWVSRMLVACFLAFGAVGVMLISRRFMGKLHSLMTCLLFVSCPIVIFWSRDTMLEMPTMAMIIWSMYHFLAFMEKKKANDVALFFVFAILAPYTKQNAVFIIPVAVLSAVITKKSDLLTDRRFLLGLLLCSLFGVPLIYLTLRWNLFNLDQSFGTFGVTPMKPLDHVLYYFSNLPDILGWPILLLAAGGALIFALHFGFRKNSSHYKTTSYLLLVWLLICFIQITLIKIKEPRHAFFWVPPFAILAGFALDRASLIMGKLNFIVITFVIALFGWNLAHAEMNWSGGYMEIAQYLKANWEGSALLIDLHRDAPLIFRLRCLDAGGDMRIYRSDKIFEKMVVYKKNAVPLIDNQDQLLKSLIEYGIRYVLIEKNFHFFTQTDRLLCELVQSEKFDKVRDFSVTLPDNKKNTYLLYRYRGALPVRASIPKIFLPIAGIYIDSDGSIKKL